MDLSDALELDTTKKIVIVMNVLIAIGNVVAAVAYGSNAIEGFRSLRSK